MDSIQFWWRSQSHDTMIQLPWYNGSIGANGPRTKRELTRHFILEVVVVLRYICHDAQPVRYFHIHHIINIKEWRDTQLLLCGSERLYMKLYGLLCATRGSRIWRGRNTRNFSRLTMMEQFFRTLHLMNSSKAGELSDVRIDYTMDKYKYNRQKDRRLH